MLTSLSPVPSDASISGAAVELAVADTPFDDEPSTPRAKPAQPSLAAPDMKKTRVVSTRAATQFEATYQPKKIKARAAAQ